MRWHSIFSGFDDWRERQAWLPAWLDDRPWKSWIWHSIIALVVGAVLGIPLHLLVPSRSFCWAWTASAYGVVMFYLIRETYNIFGEHNTRYLDAMMDWLVPFLAVTLFTFMCP